MAEAKLYSGQTRFLPSGCSGLSTILTAGQSLASGFFNSIFVFILNTASPSLYAFFGFVFAESIFFHFFVCVSLEASLHGHGFPASRSFFHASLHVHRSEEH